MSILAFGGEMGFFVPSDANAIEGASAFGGAGASYNRSFARCYTSVSGSTCYTLAPKVASQTDFWIHFDADYGAATNSSTAKTQLELLDSGGTARIRLTTTLSTSLWSLERWDGTAWQVIGTFTASIGSLQTIDIHIVCNTASGSAKLYCSGTNRIDGGTVDLSGVSNLAQPKFWGSTVGIPATLGVSQVIIANESTIGMRLMTMPATADGATSQWTGGYTSIDETVYSDGDFMFSDTTNQVQLFAGTPVSTLTGYNVRAVGVTARANTAGTGPAHIQLAIKSGATTYFSPSQALDAGYGGFVYVWETDPATTLAWTNTAATAIQFGVKSIT